MRWSLLALLVACGSSDPVLSEADTDTDADTDSDTDVDTDTDADTDTDTDADADPVDPSSLAGRTYLLDLGSGTFVEPPGIGPLLQQQVTVDMLLGTLSVDASTVQIIGAAGDGSTPTAQDMCSASIDFPPADFSNNPSFVLGPDDTALDIQGVQITIDDLFISGAFTADGSAITNATLEGSIDTRPLVDLIDPGGSEDAVCSLVSAFGIACEPCASGGTFCLSLLVNELEAPEVTGLTLSEVSQADIDLDPTCIPVP